MKQEKIAVTQRTQDEIDIAHSRIKLALSESEKISNTFYDHLNELRDVDANGKAEFLCLLRLEKNVRDLLNGQSTLHAEIADIIRHNLGHSKRAGLS